MQKRTHNPIAEGNRNSHINVAYISPWPEVINDNLLATVMVFMIYLTKLTWGNSIENDTVSYFWLIYVVSVQQHLAVKQFRVSVRNVAIRVFDKIHLFRVKNFKIYFIFLCAWNVFLNKSSVQIPEGIIYQIYVINMSFWVNYQELNFMYRTLSNSIVIKYSQIIRIYFEIWKLGKEKW